MSNLSAKIGFLERAIDAYERDETKRLDGEVQRINQTRTSMTEDKAGLMSDHLLFLSAVKKELEYSGGFVPNDVVGHVKAKVLQGSTVSKPAVESSLSDVYAVSDEEPTEADAFADSLVSGSEAF